MAKDIEEIKRIHLEKIAKLGESSPTKATLLIFVSSSQTDNNIKEMLRASRIYGATLVLRGFIEGSWLRTANYLTKFFDEGDSDIGIIVDPTLFDEYQISAVPSIVLAKDDKFDKVTGNVTLKYALETFQKEGELSDIAAQLLQVGKQ